MRNAGVRSPKMLVAQKVKNHPEAPGQKALTVPCAPVGRATQAGNIVSAFIFNATCQSN